MIRVISAGVLGGIVIFFCGFVVHTVFRLQSRAIGKFADEGTFHENVKSQNLDPGVYAFPEPPLGVPKEDVAAKEKQFNEWYKMGPNGMLIVGPKGEDPVTPKMLGQEVGSNILSAILCSFILACMSARNGFTIRLAVCFLIGLISWLSIEASYSIWYKFPNLWVMDGLICSLAEWLLAGVVMSAIVKPFYPEPVVAAN